MSLLEASKHALILVGLILTGSMASSAFGQTTRKVAGSVTVAADDNRAPIAKANITLYSPDRILGATSDAAGHFQFDNVPFGVYQLEVASPSYKTRNLDKVNVTAFTLSEDLQFTFALAFGDLNANCGRRDKVSYGPATGGATGNGSSIIGHVFLEPHLGKSPVSNARVSLLSEQGVKLDEQVTGATGEFRFKPTVPGRYLIEMRHPSYNLLRSTVFWTARENRTYLTLGSPVPVGWIIACQ